MIGQFLILGQDWSDYYQRHLITKLQPVPMTYQDDKWYRVGDDYTTPDNTKWKVVRVARDCRGLLSALMGMKTIDPMTNEEVPALQGLWGVMLEAYGDGTYTQERMNEKRREELIANYEGQLKAKQKQLKDLQDALQTTIRTMNERETSAEATIAKLKKQLREAKKRAAQEKREHEEQLLRSNKKHNELGREYAEYRKWVADGMKARPAAPTEPQPEPVAAPTNGGNDESGNNGSEPSELPGNENDSDQM